MIRTFADDDARMLFERGESQRLSSKVAHLALRKLELLDDAEAIADLRLWRESRTSQRRNGNPGKLSLPVNDQWRVCFFFKHDGAYDVEICDYR